MKRPTTSPAVLILLFLLPLRAAGKCEVGLFKSHFAGCKEAVDYADRFKACIKTAADAVPQTPTGDGSHENLQQLQTFAEGHIRSAEGRRAKCQDYHANAYNDCERVSRVWKQFRSQVVKACKKADEKAEIARNDQMDARWRTFDRKAQAFQDEEEGIKAKMRELRGRSIAGQGETGDF